jgi:hypothetical protein
MSKPPSREETEALLSDVLPPGNYSDLLGAFWDERAGELLIRLALGMEIAKAYLRALDVVEAAETTAVFSDHPMRDSLREAIRRFREGE